MVVKGRSDPSLAASRKPQLGCAADALQLLAGPAAHSEPTRIERLDGPALVHGNVGVGPRVVQVGLVVKDQTRIDRAFEDVIQE